jgi:hypothetical protein
MYDAVGKLQAFINITGTIIYDGDDDNKPVWPTWAVGVLSRSCRVTLVKLQAIWVVTSSVIIIIGWEDLILLFVQGDQEIASRGKREQVTYISSTGGQTYGQLGGGGPDPPEGPPPGPLLGPLRPPPRTPPRILERLGRGSRIPPRSGNVHTLSVGNRYLNLQSAIVPDNRYRT